MTDPNLPDEAIRTVGEQAGVWCARLAEGELSVVERKALEAWLHSSEEHQRQFDKAIALWNQLDSLSNSPGVVFHRQKALASYRSAQRKRWEVREQPLWLWIGGFAAASLVGAAVWFNQLPTEYRTGPGDRQTVTLSDGSQIALDASTLVRVAYQTHRRDIQLVRGRASFSVAHDKSRPFSVSTGHEIVVATGTAFSVERLSKQVRIVLFEGHVRVLHDTHGRQVVQTVVTPQGRSLPAETLLVPGKQLIVSTDVDAPVMMTGLISPAPETSPRAWEAGQLDFDNEELAVAAERVNRYSRDIKIVVSPDTAEVRISGTFNAGDPASFAAGVSAAFPVRAVNMAGQIALVRK